MFMEPDDIQYEFLKKMSPQQKLEAAMSLYYSAKELKSAWLRQLHTEWSEKQIEQAVREAFANAAS
ncbi:MAG: hypothetical protein ACYSSI_14160 [Planctomycetota bacterium]|jgi:hypothetical protein